MTAALLTLIAVFLLAPFFGFGLRRMWRVAVMIWIPLTAYIVFVLTRPLPSKFDEQDIMGAQAFDLILLVLIVGGLLSFAAGRGISILRARGQQNKREEATE
jgi:hypothetical protein